MRLLVARPLVAVTTVVVGTAVILGPVAALEVTPDVVPNSRSVTDVSLAVSAYVTGFSNPTAVASAADGRGRLFVAERAGRVRVVKSGRLLSRPYLDIRSRVGASGGEQGLLGLAFSPGFRNNGTLFLTYTAKDGAVILASVKAAKPGRDRARKSTLRTILRIPHPGATNHNGGSLAFGSDGLLYLGTGDGGGAGDARRQAQRLTSPAGKILRLDVSRKCGKKRYCVPQSNQYRKSSSVTKRLVFARGVRNPWRISVDSATGNLWVADVGQDKFEEVDVVSPAARNVNFGWSCKEANSGYNADQCGSLAGYVAPVATLCHEGEAPGCVPPFVGESIIGGYVYRGSLNPALRGTYVFADFISGKIFGYRSGELKKLASLGYITSFGESDSGELFAVTYSGSLYRLIAA